MKVSTLRKLVKKYNHYAVIMSEGLFGDFFGYVGMPNDSFKVMLGRNKRHALRRYLKRYKRLHGHYPKNYDSGMIFHRCPMQWGMYCVIDKNKDQTFYRL